MKTDQETTGLPLLQRLGGGETGRRLLVRVGWASAFLVGSIALVLLVTGCGARQSGGTSAESSGQTSALPAGHDVPASLPEPIGEPAPIVDGEATTEPPDVVLTLDDTQFERGESVEIRAEATPDVVELVLSDGIHAPRPFRYDAASGSWTVRYRIPLSPASERLALSATARNTTRQWCRKWVFLPIVQAEASPEAQPEAVPDSAAADGC